MQEIRLDYTNCINDAPDYGSDEPFGDMPGSAVHSAFKGGNNNVRARWAYQSEARGISLEPANTTITGERCYLRFFIPEDMGAPVYFYYYLTNFYQNHRRYVDSFDASQLRGHARTAGEIAGSDCDPLRTQGEGDDRKPYYPCGLIANSMFNDSFSAPRMVGNEGENYTMTKQGIAWSSDRDLYDETQYEIDEILPPPNWRDRYPQGYTEDNPPPNLKEWEAFQVWMRTAGLPTFSKLYQKNDNDDLREGEYEVVIDYCES